MFTSKSEDEKHDTAVTVLFQSQGLGVMRHLLAEPKTLQPPVGLQSWVNGRLLVDGDFTIKATSSHGDLTVS